MTSRKKCVFRCSKHYTVDWNWKRPPAGANQQFRHTT